MRMKFNIFLKKLDRIIAWVLYAYFLLIMISGYMITRGFISRFWGILIHTDYELPIMILFSAHAAINLKFAIMRRGIRDERFLNVLSLIFGLIPFLIILYLDKFYLR